jgi:gag-polypeptide of LTR copia-type
MANMERRGQTQQRTSAQIAPSPRINEGSRYFEGNIGRIHGKIIEIPDPLDYGKWIFWQARMTHMLRMCGVDEYVDGQIQCPDPTIDPEGAENWAFNDDYAKRLIRKNILYTQTVHVSRCVTAHEMWRNLKAVHQPNDYHTMISHVRGLIRTAANEGDDICEHLTKLQLHYNYINMGDYDFEITDPLFTMIIFSSLPPSWDDFTERYVQRFDDPKTVISSLELIGIFRAEYDRREDRKREVNNAKRMVRSPKVFARKSVRATKYMPQGDIQKHVL